MLFISYFIFLIIVFKKYYLLKRYNLYLYNFDFLAYLSSIVYRESSAL